MSSDKQDASIGQQRAAVEEMAAAEGYALLREYIDEGISGDETEKRTDFLRMRADAASGEFKAILCWDASRFGRFDSIDAGFWIKPIRDSGVWLHTVREGKIDWNTVEGRIVYNVQQDGGRQKYLTDLSAAVARGMKEAAASGRWLGVPPFGYRVDPETGRLRPEPAEVAVVRRIFDLYARKGQSARSIALGLNAEGTPSPRGGKWGVNTVLKILRSETYLGRTVWGKTSQGRYNHVGKAVREAPRKRPGAAAATVNPREDCAVTEGTHEAVIDARTWQLAQERMGERWTPKREHEGEPFVLSGLCWCGNCGSKMHATTDKRRDKWFNKYTCSGGFAKGGRVCRVRTVHEDRLAAVVNGLISQGLLADFDAAAWEEKAVRLLTERSRVDPAELARLRREAADLGRKIDQGTERYLTAPANLTAQLAAKLDEWRRAKADADAKLAELEQAAVPPEKIREAARQAVAGLGRLYAALEFGQADKVAAVYRRVVERVTVGFEDVEVVNQGKARRQAAKGLRYEPQVRSREAVVRVKIKPDAFTVRNLCEELFTWDNRNSRSLKSSTT
jgi:DNA invertase Pin-like site-specific DNA recombinase